MGLNDFVAMKEGYFAAEGLDVEFDGKRSNQIQWKNEFQRPQDKPYQVEGRRRPRRLRGARSGIRSATGSARS